LPSSTPTPRFQSAHPIALFFLFLFRIAAIAVYILCGFFTDNYVLSVSLGNDLPVLLNIHVICRQ
jgi:hypothetical protein